MASFEILFQTGMSLHPDGEPSEFISSYAGVIRCVKNEDGSARKVGRLLVHRIHAGLACGHGESLFDVCDSHSQEMHELQTLLYEPGSYHFREKLLERFEAIEPDCLVLDYIVLSPRWRGLKLGLLAVRKAIDLLGGGCGLVVADIAPLIPEAHAEVGVPRSWVPEGDHREATRKLRTYFRRMGFRRLGRTPYFALSLARKAPTAADLLRPSSD